MVGSTTQTTKAGYKDVMSPTAVPVSATVVRDFDRKLGVLLRLWDLTDVNLCKKTAEIRKDST